MLAIATTAQEAARRVADLPKQIRFASMKAVNATALDAQRFTVGTLLPEKFTLRAKGAPWWKPGNRFGFNIRFANKENLTATMGSRADWLKLQEEGGTKGAGAGRVAVPTLGAARPSKGEVIPRKFKPRRLKGAFLVQSKTGRTLIMARPRKGQPAEVFWGLLGSMTVKPRFDFRNRATTLVEKVYPEHFRRELLKAIATAR